MAKSKEQLIIENEELRSRLIEMEEAIGQSGTEKWMLLWFLVIRVNKFIL
jgi:hypothetical protein